MTQSSQFDARIRSSVDASIAAMETLREDSALLSTVSAIAEEMIRAFRAGNKVLLFGNGGSASDAHHLATELLGRFAFDRPGLPALSLAESTTTVTALANDYGFDQVFARQIVALGRPGDVAIALSTSGNSPNVLNGVAAANKAELFTVGLTGKSGGKLRSLVKQCVCVPSDDVPRIQECHTLIGHILSQIVEQELFGQKNSVAQI
jgi:D-sedoheptulose 7-phosphate isomerase